MGDKHVQDPYSLRCQPQVTDACFDLIRQASATLLTEANVVTDNPLIYTDADEVISSGNFHAEPVAFTADILALTIVEIGVLSERHIALLVDSTLSDLPPFLVEQPGLNSSFVIAHVTAATLASENKTSAHLTSVDSLPTSASQEDYVGMVAFTSRRSQDMAENTATIVGIEALAAAQDIDFHEPLATSNTLQKAYDCIRAHATYYDEDRLFAPDVEATRRLVLDGDLGGSYRAHVDELALI